MDPALVMQYFGSKRGLFTRALQTAPAPRAPGDGAALLDQLPATLGVKLGGMPDGTLAVLRSMLTDPASADHAREALGRQISGIGGALPASEDGADGELRAALIITTMLGVTIGRQLLGLDVLRDAPAERIGTLLRPAIAALTEPPD
ncbi:hypothetical protein EES39_40115 [Streptomyces sp. ADI92-24]|uniref:TetR/AcrR family transcriptional regulator n=1 Tax=unclassified Streptomyces TaxID=2593676 RepID=UPI000F5536C8|nr:MULTISPECIES: TetR/AcrR family transcriptional regulator [unclassified Streptomyces]MCX4774075.1 TetR/AcrR family transcriptional regulator [Streptomyces sp. NBC_01285]RPK29344.1 hypothetical protein EES39_40115 [Streptomyces sp. ADI92-24]